MNKEKQIEIERNEISEILAQNFDLNGEKWDASDFEWSAHCVQMAGYRKASEIFEEIEEGIKAAVSALQFEKNPIHRQVKHETYSSLMRFTKSIQEKHTEEGK